jgi:hypothetical protein
MGSPPGSEPAGLEAPLQAAQRTIAVDRLVPSFTLQLRKAPTCVPLATSATFATFSVAYPVGGRAGDRCRVGAGVSIAMLQARDAVGQRSWSHPQEPASQDWWADMLADPRARQRRPPQQQLTVLKALTPHANGHDALHSLALIVFLFPAVAREPEHLRNAVRCGAKTRSGKPCRSPAVTGKRRCVYRTVCWMFLWPR